MASSNATTTEESQERDAQDQNFELRRILNNAYSFVQGQQTTQSFTALTYEELADRQIERIEGAGSPGRPNELERIDKMEQELIQLVAQVRSIPPENFLLKDADRDVNTAPEG
jgi:hypothetical protein